MIIRFKLSNFEGEIGINSDHITTVEADPGNAEWSIVNYSGGSLQFGVSVIGPFESIIDYINSHELPIKARPIEKVATNMTFEERKIASCPFCGAGRNFISAVGSGIFITCGNCMSTGPKADTTEMAVSRWNTGVMDIQVAER